MLQQKVWGPEEEEGPPKSRAAALGEQGEGVILVFHRVEGKVWRYLRPRVTGHMGFSGHSLPPFQSQSSLTAHDKPRGGKIRDSV